MLDMLMKTFTSQEKGLWKLLYISLDNSHIEFEFTVTVYVFIFIRRYVETVQFNDVE